MIQETLKNFLNAVRHLGAPFFPAASTRAFIKHNRMLWGRGVRNSDKKGEILFEYNDMHSAVIAYSYLADALARHHEARIVPFVLNERLSFPRRIYNQFLRRFERLYRSFGAGQVLSVEVTPLHRLRADQRFREIYPKLTSKRDIEDISINGIRFGDLIYDHYLRKYSVPTIDLEDERFGLHLKEFFGLLVAWEDYLETHDVKAVNVSHTVYKAAILPRLAISRGIPAYQANATHVYRMSRQNLRAYTDFSDYPRVFRALPEEVRRVGLAEAESRLARRFSGAVGVDMGYSSKSAYGMKTKTRILTPSNRTKVLIATHCFFDSPHPYGINLFPDFFEWLSFLGDISEITDYDWYIKTHPDFLPGNTEIIKEFLERYPKFRLLPSESSHHQIIDEGINAVLTVYGTIGFEYAALNVPVVNASKVNPHHAYDFNIHPADPDEYREILMNLDTLQISIDKHKVHEYYFMKHIYNTNDWLFEDHQAMLLQLGGYREQFTPRVYDYYLDHLSPERHSLVCRTVANFVRSNDHRLSGVHIPRGDTSQSDSGGDGSVLLNGNNGSQINVSRAL